MVINYEPGEPEIAESAARFLNALPHIKRKITDKIIESLGIHLFNKRFGNKEILCGPLKGYYSARVGFGYVAIYCVEGSTKKHAVVLAIKTESDYHNWLNLKGKRRGNVKSR